MYIYIIIYIYTYIYTVYHIYTYCVRIYIYIHAYILKCICTISRECITENIHPCLQSQGHGPKNEARDFERWWTPWLIRINHGMITLRFLELGISWDLVLLYGNISYQNLGFPWSYDFKVQYFIGFHGNSWFNGMITYPVVNGGSYELSFPTTS